MAIRRSALDSLCFAMSSIASVLSLGFSAAALAQVVDQGVVVIDAGGHLHIGIDAFGQRDVVGVTDGPYSAITVGEGVDGDGTLNVSGGRISTDGELRVDHGSVYVTDSGSLVTDHSSMLSATPRTQSVTVEGAGSSWTNAGQLDLGGSGYFANARVRLRDGATGRTSGLTLWADSFSAVSVELDGVGTEFVNVGDLLMGRSTRGSPTFTVTGGARYTSAGTLRMDDYADTTILVSGQGSTFEVGSAQLAGLGAESVRIGTGGHLITGDARLFSQTTARVFIEDPGSRWTVNGALELALNGAGGSNILSILDGAIVDSVSGLVDSNTDSQVTVSGVGSEWNVLETLEVRGVSGSKILVENGGLLTSGPTSVGTTSCSSPHAFRDCVITVDGAGSRWISSADLSVGSAGNAAGRVHATRGAQITIASSITVTSGGFLILEDGSIGAASLDLAGGQLSGVGVVDAPVISASSVRVGSDGLAEAGDLLVTGSYTQLASGTLDLTLVHSAGDGSDRLLIDGDAILAGVLSVSALSTYDAAVGDTFDLLVADDIVGEFDVVLLPARANQFSWELQYIRSAAGPDVVQLKAIPEPTTALLVGVGVGLIAATRVHRIRLAGWSQR